jgi:hypothetical protein
MSDDTKYGLRKKRIIFYDTDKKQAELKIRLKYDNLRQSEFFRLIVDHYLRQTDEMIQIIDQYKKEVNSRDKMPRIGNKKLFKKAADLKSKFALDDKEVESIFDILQKEYPDL